MNKRITIIGWLVFWIMGFNCVAAPSSLELNWQDKPAAIFSITLRSPIAPQIFMLENPPRLVIDLPHHFEPVELAASAWQGSCIHSFRQAYHQDKDYLRLVFELCKPLGFVLKTPFSASIPEKWQIELAPKSTKDPLVNDKQKPLPTSTILSAPHSKLRKVIVLIDPGHGGKDPGAIGMGGIQEKTVVLAIAQRLYHLIQQEPGMTAVMTRSDDTYLTLRERLKIARENKADIFVAIHADIFKYARSRGSSVYALSLKGATSEAARWLAEKDNYSELGGVDLQGKDDILRSVLIDLSQKATITSSLHLGVALLHEMGLLGPLHSTNVEQARFVVLKSPDIPSVLVETGFLSNPKEIKKLTDTYYQEQLAASLLKGLKQYFSENPPPGTWFTLHS